MLNSSYELNHTCSYDPSTLSQPNQVLINSIQLDLIVDFDRTCLHGTSRIHAEVIANDTTEFILDVRDIQVTKVTLDVDALSLVYRISQTIAPFGEALIIELPIDKRQRNTKLNVIIAYSTSSASSALQWLSGTQTSGGEHPFLFSQCQAIHARSLTPCQDTPLVKMRYGASLTVPEPLTALMSATSVSNKSTPHTPGWRIFHFEQNIPIPSYLLALAVGKLEKKDIGPRSAIWAEQEVLDAAAYEFEDTEIFLSTAESICGPYVWGRYDMLCLPPSFPYGGMENPCLTFVTPTLLAGDKSLASVVAHEIAHSWTGNLVTNRTWEHFWLNEGFTVYVERKIIGALQGDAMFHFRAIIGMKHLQDAIDLFGNTNPLTHLCPKLTGIDPDDAFSSVPYEKGFNFLFYLESLLGREQFESFLKEWISKHKYQTVDTDMFRDELLAWFHDSQCTALARIDWDSWLYAPGMPPVQNQFDQTLHKAVLDSAQKWINSATIDNTNVLPNGSCVRAFSANQQVAFLDHLLQNISSLTAAVFVALEECTNFNESQNAEIRFRFITLGIKLEQEQQLSHAVHFLTSQGRMKFVRPLYRTLHASTIGRDLAKSTFAKNEKYYHNICSKMVRADLAR